MDDSVPQSGRARRVAEKLEAEFDQRVGCSYNQGAKDEDAQQLIAKLQKKCELLNPHVRVERLRMMKGRIRIRPLCNLNAI
jgi:Skp family chaperone for outer membrane proteins